MCDSDHEIFITQSSFRHVNSGNSSSDDGTSGFSPGSFLNEFNTFQFDSGTTEVKLHASSDYITCGQKGETSNVKGKPKLGDETMRVGALVSDSDLLKIYDDNIPENTMKKIRWSAQLFEKWRTERNRLFWNAKLTLKI